LDRIYERDTIESFRCRYDKINRDADDAINFIRLHPLPDQSKTDSIIIMNEELRNEHTAILNEEVGEYIESAMAIFQISDEEEQQKAREQMMDLYLALPTLNRRDYDKIIATRYGKRSGSPMDAASSMGPIRYNNAIERNKRLLAKILELGCFIDG